jgi:hypothetical protein
MFSIANRLTGVLTGICMLAGCATGPTQYEDRALSAQQRQVVADKPAELQPLYRDLFQEGRRNEVLNLMEIGAKAFRQGHDRIAKAVLDRAIGNIESVYADNEAARKARSLWYEEGEKDFKGEPYERSMVYFYRGLLFLKEADYGNARASFISGLLQDAFAEEKQHTADFASLVFLAGWAAKLDGKDKLARNHFAEFRQLRPDSPVPDDRDNVLVIAETGTSPRKLADGVGHYELVYRRGKGFAETRARVSVNGETKKLYPVEDVFFQASTRGGRTVDRIIEGQVKFKKGAEQVGSNLTAVSDSNVLAGAAAASGGAVAAGAGLITAIGVAAQGLSARSKTRADTRYWHRLPDAVHARTLSRPEGSGPLRVEFLDENGRVVPGLTDRVQIHFDQEGNGLAFASSRPDR